MPAAPAVFQYRLSSQPDTWLYVIAGGGADLDGAFNKLARRFGGDLIEVRHGG